MLYLYRAQIVKRHKANLWYWALLLGIIWTNEITMDKLVATIYVSGIIIALYKDNINVIASNFSRSLELLFLQKTINMLIRIFYICFSQNPPSVTAICTLPLCCKATRFPAKYDTGVNNGNNSVDRVTNLMMIFGYNFCGYDSQGRDTVCVFTSGFGNSWSPPRPRWCLYLPELPKLSQQSRVGAALLRAGLACCVMLCTETSDLCQDLSGK